MNYIISTFITLPLGAAFLMPVLARLNRRLPDIVSSLVTLYLAIAAASLYLIRPFGASIIYKVAGWPAPVGINLIMDGLSHLLILTVNLVVLFIAIYSIPYMEKYTGKALYYALFMLVIAGMNGVILTGDMVNMFLFLELASIASAALVAFGTKAEEMEASFKYMIIGSIASCMILFAIALIFGLCGSTNMMEASSGILKVSGNIKLLITALFICGFGTKAAIVPFHAWLPDAHPSAPAPISAMLSGVLIKSLGIYSITRIIYNVLGMTIPVSIILTTLGTFSIIWGSFLALRQDDMKRLLASSSISQIGYIVIGIGLATPLGVIGGLLHLFNHAIFKSLLFLTAGSVDSSTGTRSLKQLGGLRKSMPVTANSSLAASLAISGIPPFNGFWSKLLIIIACIQAGRLWIAFVAVIGSIITLVYSFRIQDSAFFGAPIQPLQNIKESPFLMSLSMALLALICLGTGLFFYQVIAVIINPAVAAIAAGTLNNQIQLGGF